MDYVTIDFEASCLPRHGRSFPIEVAIADPAGTRSWLIKPHALWRDWDWTDEAFSLHGIGRDQLNDEGLEPEIVLAELTRAIAGRRVISDSTVDSQWWKTLVDAAGQRLASPILHIGRIFDEWGATTTQILFAQQRADSLCRARHRAGADAHWLWILMSTIQQALTERAEASKPLLRRPFTRFSASSAGAAA